MAGDPAERVPWLARALNADLMVTASHHPSLRTAPGGILRAEHRQKAAVSNAVSKSLVFMTAPQGGSLQQANLTRTRFRAVRPLAFDKSVVVL